MDSKEISHEVMKKSHHYIPHGLTLKNSNTITIVYPWRVNKTLHKALGSMPSLGVGGWRDKVWTQSTRHGKDCSVQHHRNSMGGSSAFFAAERSWPLSNFILSPSPCGQQLNMVERAKQGKGEKPVYDGLPCGK